MSKGALLLATPHETIDYIGFAKLAAKLVEKHLDIETHIHVGEAHLGNTRAFRWHNGQVVTVPWYNSDRTLAYDLSPYDETLLIDVDYLTFNDNLKQYFGSANEFLCYDRVWDVTSTNSFRNDQRMTRAGHPMLWATVVYFRKCDLAHNIFEMMKNVQANWRYYAKFWGFTAGKYRNDFSLTIAHQLMNGYASGTYFNHPLGSLSTMDTIYSANGDELRIRYQDGDKYNAVKLKGVNLHCMNKACLQDPEIYGALDAYATQG